MWTVQSWTDIPAIPRKVPPSPLKTRICSSNVNNRSTLPVHHAKSIRKLQDLNVLFLRIHIKKVTGILCYVKVIGGS